MESMIKDEGFSMGKVMAGMTMSLDGFINDRNGSAQSLNPDFTELLTAASFKKTIEATGADTIQQCLNSGLCDELQIDVMPLLLGKGLRLFENIDTDTIKLERIKVEETTTTRTSITFKVI